MIVHIVTATRAITDSIEQLREIIATIEAEGHSLALDWVEPAYTQLAYQPDSHFDWPTIYARAMDAVTKCDIVIAEASTATFGVGYQIAVATRHKKPILILRREDASDDSMVAAVAEEGVVLKKYTPDTLVDLVRNFLRENDIPAKDMRFNFFIDRQIYNYLRWASFKTGKNKSEFLRDLINKEIEKEKT